jgi:hypothetical protein
MHDQAQDPPRLLITLAKVDHAAACARDAAMEKPTGRRAEQRVRASALDDRVNRALAGGVGAGRLRAAEAN